MNMHKEGEVAGSGEGEGRGGKGEGAAQPGSYWLGREFFGRSAFAAAAAAASNALVVANHTSRAYRQILSS